MVFVNLSRGLNQCRLGTFAGAKLKDQLAIVHDPGRLEPELVNDTQEGALSGATPATKYLTPLCSTDKQSEVVPSTLQSNRPRRGC